VTFGDDALTLGQTIIEADLTYETVLIDAVSRHPAGSFALPVEQQVAQMRTGAAARAPLRKSGPRRYAPAPGSKPLVTLGAETFVVVSTEDLGVRSDVTAPTTKTRAAAALEGHLAANPAERGKLQVMRSSELPHAA
jgi:hypothetical protein